MILPSRELLSAVLVYSSYAGVYEEVTWIELEGKYLQFTANDGNVEEDINIYELMKLMKVWALTKGFYVLSMIDEFGGMALASTKKESAIHDEVASEEAEAVFKICEWILNQQKDK